MGLPPGPAWPIEGGHVSAGHARQPAASRLARVAFVGNSLPRRCGIATFTSDLQQAVAGRANGIDTAIVAMTDHAQSYDYPADVRFQVADGDLADYVRAAEFINSGGYVGYRRTVSAILSWRPPAEVQEGLPALAVG